MKYIRIAMDLTSPISYIKVPMHIEAKFLNSEGDKFAYYHGTITKINEIGANEHGRFIDCSVIYDDGDEVSHSIFNDVDFESDNDDSWRFTDMNSKIIKMLSNNCLDIKDLKENMRMLFLRTIQALHQDVKEDDDEEEEEDDDEDEEEEEEEEEDEEEDEDEDEDEEDEEKEEEEEEEEETSISEMSDDIVEYYKIVRRKFQWRTFFGGLFTGFAAAMLVNISQEAIIIGFTRLQNIF